MASATDVKYETKSVQTIRGLEGRTRANLENEGWEFVKQTTGTLRSELTFRRPKPKTPWKLIGMGGGLLALVAIAVVLGNVFGGDENENVAESSRTPSVSENAPAEVTPVPTASAGNSAPSAPTTAPLATATDATDTTVDELLDRLNSAAYGGIELGDRFRFAGELFGSEYWMTSASGDYVVMLRAQGGAQDLPVFVDESAAAQWRDGTQVEMTVEMVEATINGETTDGWLRALSVTTLP